LLTLSEAIREELTKGFTLFGFPLTLLTSVHPQSGHDGVLI